LIKRTAKDEQAKPPEVNEKERPERGREPIRLLA
jgi:hypothetical protein